MKVVIKAKCTGYGSAQRSATCSFEHGYISFLINGVEYRWFNEKAEWERPFIDGMWYDLKCTLTGKRTMQRVKALSGPHKENKWL